MTFKKQWIYINNPFLDIINFKKMDDIGKFTTSALLAEPTDPDITHMTDILVPVYKAYNIQYVAYKSGIANQKGSTRAFETYLKDLSSKAGSWDVEVRHIYPVKSDNYLRLMPYRVRPFQTGTYQERLNAISGLLLRIGDDESLADLKTLIQTFYDGMLTARNNQLTKEGLVKNYSDALEAKRIDLAKNMFKVHGLLITKFFNNPDDIARFYDFTKLRNYYKKADDMPDVGMNIKLHPGEIRLVPLRITRGEVWLFVNIGNTPVKPFLYSEDKEPKVPDTAPTIEDGQTLQLKAMEMGGPDDIYLYIQNVSNVESGEVNLVQMN